MSRKHKAAEAGEAKPSTAPAFYRWRRFLIAVLLLVAFIYSASALERVPVIGAKIAVLRESGINVGAWYYDNVEEYFEAEDYIQNRMQRKEREGSNKTF